MNNTATNPTNPTTIGAQFATIKEGDVIEWSGSGEGQWEVEELQADSGNLITLRHETHRGCRSLNRQSKALVGLTIRK